MTPTLALIAAAWLLSRPEVRRWVRSESLAAFGIVAFTLLVLLYGRRFT